MQKSKIKNFPSFKKSKKAIYLDHASSTPIDRVVLNLIYKSMKEDFANPSGIHELSLKTKNKLIKARSEIAKILKCKTEEIIFTSGATESNNLAILGVLNSETIPHIISSNIEHSSVLEILRKLEKEKKIELTLVEVDKDGLINPKEIKKYLKLNTVLVSIGYANNEIGVIQLIREIAKEIRYFNKIHQTQILFHTDATQSINYLSIDTEYLSTDLMSFNAHKIYGPKGIGILYKKKNTNINNIFYGGGQEFGFRPGTENVPLVFGFCEALKICEKMKVKEVKRLTKLQNYFIQKLKKIVPDLIINGSLEYRLPNNINITIPNIPSDLLLVELSARNIFVSEKSACKSGDKQGSYVISALYHDTKQNIPSLRFSLGRGTSKEDLDYTIEALSYILKKLSLWYK